MLVNVLVTEMTGTDFLLLLLKVEEDDLKLAFLCVKYCSTWKELSSLQQAELVLQAAV